VSCWFHRWSTGKYIRLFVLHNKKWAYLDLSDFDDTLFRLRKSSVVLDIETINKYVEISWTYMYICNPTKATTEKTFFFLVDFTGDLQVNIYACLCYITRNGHIWISVILMCRKRTLIHLTVSWKFVKLSIYQCMLSAVL
jgi:hypothetical protein